MSEPFVGELMVVGFNFPPKGWASCTGQQIAISQNTALFSLLGTSFGGNGKTTFGLPNLQGSVSVGAGQAPGLSSYQLGETGGTSTVTLLTTEVPPHNHSVMANSARPNQSSPANNAFAVSQVGEVYNNASVTPSNLAAMSPQTLPPAGGSQPHNNMMPYLALNWIICLSGIYPSRP